VGEAVSEGYAVSWNAVVAGCGAERVYVTMDSRESRAAYEEFREKFAREYGELDRECEGLAVIEKQLGEYET
jgi:hypothetical protein